MLNKTFVFKAIHSRAHLVGIFLKNTIILNSVVKRKVERVVKESFICIKHAHFSSYTSIIKALSKVNAVIHNKTSENMIAFLNELETLGLVYQLVFCRMMALRWKERPRFMSVQHLVRSYLQTLWMKNPDKYEYVQDLIEENGHVYTVLLDDLANWHYEHIKRRLLSYTIIKIKTYSKPKYKKLENLIRILNKFNQKLSKIYLLDFISKVNKTRPKESLFYLLNSLFNHHSSVNKQLAFNKIKMLNMKKVYQSGGKSEAFNLLKNLFDSRKQQTYNSMPYRSMFPIEKGASIHAAADGLRERLEKLFRRRTGDGMATLKKHFADHMTDILTSGREIIDTIETHINIMNQKQAELVKSVLEKVFLRSLGLPFRSILKDAFLNDASRFKIFTHLDSLLMKRYLAGFNHIKAEADFNRDQELLAAREGFTLLDSFFKNKINAGRLYLRQHSVRSRL